VPIQEEAACTAVEGNSSSNSEGINVGSQDGAQQRHQGSDDRIYARGATLYWEAGWRAPLPFPPGRKAPPPKGYTGYEGRWPDDEQIGTWGREQPRLSNIALRVNYGLVGIDVDAYDSKTGGLTLKEAETRWGPLPATYRSSSRIDDEVSGIRVFRVPLGMFFRSAIEVKDKGYGDIETIQPHLRYVTAWPSIHPTTGQQYRWFGPDGTFLPEARSPASTTFPSCPRRGWLDWRRIR
jgi:Bifunctional DNA primase/polymerase, N-terminal